jgi:hypothetical protein
MNVVGVEPAKLTYKQRRSRDKRVEVKEGT